MSASLRQHATFPNGTTLAGIVVRATDDQNFFLIRAYMHASQAGADELEAVEVIGGVANVVHKVHLGDHWTAGGANVLAVRCVGDRVHGLLDGQPRMSVIPSVPLTGTRYGLCRMTGDDGCTFDDWSVAAL